MHLPFDENLCAELATAEVCAKVAGPRPPFCAAASLRAKLAAAGVRAEVAAVRLQSRGRRRPPLR